uniref:Uncharacterized protein n=1 Tax=Oryza brachyantha TaxID=4533 RepID=J3N5F8_ORYBR
MATSDAFSCCCCAGGTSRWLLLHRTPWATRALLSPQPPRETPGAGQRRRRYGNNGREQLVAVDGSRGGDNYCGCDDDGSGRDQPAATTMTRTHQFFRRY